MLFQDVAWNVNLTAEVGGVMEWIMKNVKV
jgi:hypothetical protein